MKTCAASAIVTALLWATPTFAADMPAKTTSPAVATYHATGVVSSLNAAKGTITVATEPVPALKWPAVTMPYSISGELAAGVKPGNRVNIEFTAKGMDTTILKIAVVK